MTKEEWKMNILNKLDTVRKLVESSESAKTLAVISLRKHQEDLQKAMEILDEIEEEIKTYKAKTWFDWLFGNPMDEIDSMFDRRVHKAIEDIDGINNVED